MNLTMHCIARVLLFLHVRHTCALEVKSKAHTAARITTKMLRMNLTTLPLRPLQRCWLRLDRNTVGSCHSQRHEKLSTHLPKFKHEWGDTVGSNPCVHA
jgi:hypothetical protein